MKIKTFIYTALTFATIGLVASCSEDLLEIEQHGIIDPDKTYAEADDATADQLIGEVYHSALMMTTGDWGIDFFLTPTVKVAESWPGGSGPNDGMNYQQMAQLTDNSENGAYQNVYQRLYKIIYQSNQIVEKLNTESTERKRVVAEAKAWRAWSMMHLVQMWGSAPLVSHTLDGSADYPYYPANTDPKESWQWIMEQFEEAITDLPTKSGLGGQKAIGGRWTKEAAEAFMGKGYIWQNDFVNAKKYLAEVIKSHKYELWTKTKTMANAGVNVSQVKNNNASTWVNGSEEYEYLTLFRSDADFCDEYLLELDVDGDGTTIDNTSPYWFWAYCGWRQDQFYMPANANTGDGWGFVTPTLNFGLAFCKHDGNSIRRRMSIATYDEVLNDFPYVNSTTKGVMGGKKLFDNQGYFRMKYYNYLDDEQPERYAAGNLMGNQMNFPLMRYSNVLLMYAEAVCQTGSEGDAGITGLQALNMVRERAGLTAAPRLDMDNETYGIKAERRFELYLEDWDRYVDLIRWGDYSKYMQDKTENGIGEYWGKDCTYLVGLKDSNKRTTDPTDLSNYEIQYDEITAPGTWSDKFLLLPFPYAEINANKNLTQNSGW